MASNIFFSSEFCRFQTVKFFLNCKPQKANSVKLFKIKKAFKKLKEKIQQIKF